MVVFKFPFVSRYGSIPQLSAFRVLGKTMKGDSGVFGEMICTTSGTTADRHFAKRTNIFLPTVKFARGK
jgi:hypothetical protein